MPLSRHANLEAALAGLALDKTAHAPLHRQLESALRSAILSGELPAHARLPSSRSLAALLGVSRTTVTEALEVLGAEGYVRGRVGSGTFVRGGVGGVAVAAVEAALTPSRRGAALAALQIAPYSAPATPPRAFRSGMPDVRLFPWRVWSALSARLAGSTAVNLGYGDPAGLPELREAVAAYLGAARGVHCTPEQVVIVSGSQQGLDLAARVLLDEGDAALVEDPGYLGARAALAGAGLRCVPTPVDADGLDVAAGEARAPNARLAYVTPSHQYPLGSVMSAARRLELLEWAARGGAWILEDDYDGEYRYAGAPLSALHQLAREQRDTAGRVLYLGTFSKVLFPALRLGYLVVPPALAPAFHNAKNALDRSAPTLTSAVLAAFIAEGHFARHLRRTRKAYAARHAALLGQQAVFGEKLTLRSSQAGLHLVGQLPPGVSDVEVARRAREVGVEVNALSLYASQGVAPGLVLGYAAVNEAEIEISAQVLSGVL